jgi:hypothetical protein
MREKRRYKMLVIREKKVKMGNNETAIAKGVYQNNDGSFSWITFTRSGTCKKLETALKKAGF